MSDGLLGEKISHSILFVSLINNSLSQTWPCQAIAIILEGLSIQHLGEYNPNEPPRGKTTNVVSEQLRHKPACTSTQKSWKLKISDLSRRGIVLSE